METTPFVLDLVLALSAAFAGGMIARKLGLPVLLGYIIGGVLIGPYTPGPFAASERVDLLANLGVGFLMFALGVEFSFNELVRVNHHRNCMLCHAPANVKGVPTGVLTVAVPLPRILPSR